MQKTNSWSVNYWGRTRSLLTPNHIEVSGKLDELARLTNGWEFGQGGEAIDDEAITRSRLIVNFFAAYALSLIHI